MTEKRIAILLFILIIGLSFLKDLITPDYLNSPNAAFLLIPERESFFQLIFSHKFFWILSLVYSAAFVYFPWMIIRNLFGMEMARYTFWILLMIAVAEYMMILSGNQSLSIHVIPKINRYLHSPILLLFFIAAFTLNNRKNGLN